MQALWILAAAFLFATMGVCVKLALRTHSVWEVVFYRNLIGMAILLPLLMRGQTLRTGLHTPHWRQHLIRNFSGTLSVVLWFSSMAYLPLSTAMTLNYTSSLFIAGIVFISAPTPRVVSHHPLLLALLVGFCGILLVLRPTVTSGQLPWALVGLAAGLLASFALLSVRALGRLGEPGARTVFYFSISGTLAGGLGMLCTGWHSFNGSSISLMLGVGFFAVLAQLAITRAYGYGKTLLAANLNYSGILFASFYGVIFWQEAMTLPTLLGMLLIVISGAYATWHSNQSSQN